MVMENVLEEDIAKEQSDLLLTSRFQSAVDKILAQDKLGSGFGTKKIALQMFEMLRMNPGVILVGSRGAGKSTVVGTFLKAYRAALNAEADMQGDLLPCCGRTIRANFPCVHIISPRVSAKKMFFEQRLNRITFYIFISKTSKKNASSSWQFFDKS